MSSKTKWRTHVFYRNSPLLSSRSVLSRSINSGLVTVKCKHATVQRSNFDRYCQKRTEIFMIPFVFHALQGLFKLTVWGTFYFAQASYISVSSFYFSDKNLFLLFKFADSSKCQILPVISPGKNNFVTVVAMQCKFLCLRIFKQFLTGVPKILFSLMHLKHKPAIYRIRSPPTPML